MLLSRCSRRSSWIWRRSKRYTPTRCMCMGMRPTAMLVPYKHQCVVHIVHTTHTHTGVCRGHRQNIICRQGGISCWHDQRPRATPLLHALIPHLRWCCWVLRLWATWLCNQAKHSTVLAPALCSGRGHARGTFLRWDIGKGFSTHHVVSSCKTHHDSVYYYYMHDSNCAKRQHTLPCTHTHTLAYTHPTSNVPCTNLSTPTHSLTHSLTRSHTHAHPPTLIRWSVLQSHQNLCSRHLVTWSALQISW